MSHARAAMRAGDGAPAVNAGRVKDITSQSASPAEPLNIAEKTKQALLYQGKPWNVLKQST
jgi:hypothetical protein